MAENWSDVESVETEERNAVESLLITKARCNKFIETENRKICNCGLELDKHHDEVQKSYRRNGQRQNEKWNIQTCVVEDGLTDAFGEVRFVNNDHCAKYARVYHTFEINKITRLLFDFWKLERPTLIISVTGGAQKFSLNKRLQDVFRRGLIKAASSTGAWISTGGTNVGVMKHVGEAMYENALNLKEKIVCLGIAPWQMIDQKELLISNNNYDDYVADYQTVPKWQLEETSAQDHKPTYLDPNHSHFLLVDNAHIGYGGEIEFRGRLEAAISNSSENGIPIVVLVLEGGVGTIKTVLESVKNGTPCVFIEGSGKCADILAYAIRDIKSREKTTKQQESVDINNNLDQSEVFQIKNKLRMRYKGIKEDEIQKIYPLVMKAQKRIDKNLEREIRSRLDFLGKEFKSVKTQEDYANAYEDIEMILGSDDLLNVFSLDDDNQIDVIILTALLKNKKNNYDTQLKLAMSWNRVDIAKGFIFKDIKLNPEQLNLIMVDAILSDRVNFVKLIMENDFNLKSFLTTGRLFNLYRDGLKSVKNKDVKYLRLLYTKRNMPIITDFEKIKEILQKLIDDLYKPTFSISSEKDEFDNPKHQLFLFSILIVRPLMAKVFIRETTNPIFLALLASKIYSTLEKLSDDNEKNNFLTQAQDFEGLAERILDNCYKTDEKNSQRLLMRKIPEFDNLTCLQVAVSANNLTFVSHQAVQGLLTTFWHGRILPDTPIYWILLCIVFPFLAPACITFRAEKKDAGKKKSTAKLARQESTMEESKQKTKCHPLDYLKKVYSFLRAPITKFIYFQSFYVLFLLLFSYVMLCDFYPAPARYSITNNGQYISIIEMFLIIWVTMYLIDEIRQFVEIDVRTFKSRLRVYFNLWNTIHLIALVLYYLGMILRFIPGSYDVYMAARVILCVDLLIWYINCLSFYTVLKKLGPKIQMITKMLYELMYFIFIVIIFMFAFGVVTQALMYHNQELNSQLLKNVFFPAYFVIGGEYFTRDKIMTAGTCVPNNTLSAYDSYTQSDCPNHVGAQVTLVIYVVYIIILNILLVNLLIAIFNSRYQEVQTQADKIWKFQRYSLIYEYYHKPILPPPLSILSYIISLIRLILSNIRKCCMCCNCCMGCKCYMCCTTLNKENAKNYFARLFLYFSKEWQSGFVMEIDKSEDRHLKRWEEERATDYLHQVKQKNKDNEKTQIEKCNEKINKLMEMLNSRAHVTQDDESENKVAPIVQDRGGTSSRELFESLNTDNKIRSITRRDIALTTNSTETMTPVVVEDEETMF